MISSLRSIRKIINQLNGIIDTKQRFNVLWLFCMMILSSILELLGVSAILPFVQAITNINSIMENKYVAWLCDVFNIDNSTSLILGLGITLIAIYLLKNTLLVYVAYVQNDFATKIQMQLSIRMLTSYMNRPYTFFTDTDSSEIIRGCSADVSSVYTIIVMLTDVVTQCLTVTVIGFFLVCADPFTALTTLALMMIIMLGILFIFKPTFKQCGKRAQELTAETTKALYQAVGGIKEILVMQRRKLFIDRYKAAGNESRVITRRYGTLNAMPDRIVEGICISGIIGIICIRLTIRAGDMASFIPTLSAFALGAFKILPSIGKIASRMNAVIFSMPGLEKVYQNIGEIEQYEELNNSRNDEGCHESVQNAVGFEKEISISHVFWQYNNAPKPVLTDASMVIRKGESIGLIGSSGAGKTTLSDIILGLMKPLQGQVTLDGVDVYTIPKSWAQIVGYVPQFVYLINDTIRENIAFGLRETEIEDDKIWDSLERAQIADYVRQLPKGLDTLVGERGIKFSGGQRQRIAIARALYNRPEILVLDEATASLDNETESAVMDAIDTLQGQITLIIVAHRLTTIKNCDHIYEVKDGVIIERDKIEIMNSIANK